MPFLVPAITSVATWVSTTLAAGGIQAFFLRTAGTLVLTAAAQKLMPQPQVGSLSRPVSVRAPVASREIVYGSRRKGGVIVFLHSRGDRDQYLHLVIALAGHQVQSIGSVYFNGEEAVDAAGTAVGRYAGKVTVEKALGTENQMAFPGLRAAVPEKWTSAHRLVGIAAIHLQLTYDPDVFPSGIPNNITVDLDGKNDVFDPRLGTRGYTNNAALCLADYISLTRFGLGASYGTEDGIDPEDLIEAANISDEEVPRADGGSEPRYACNGVVSLAQAPKTNIEALLTAMAGTCVMEAGRWRIHAGAYRIPEVTLGPDDIRPGGMTLSTRISMAENCNAVRGQFISPENDWQPDDFPAVASDVYLTEDQGERRWRDISLPFTTSASCAQRLAKIELERTRRQMSVRLAGKLTAWAADVGGTVALDYARWGFEAKPFEVVRQSLELARGGEAVALLPDMTLRETSPLVYDWDASEEQIYAAAPRTTLPSGFDLPAPGTPEVTESLYVTRDGGALKIKADITWAPSASAFVERYQIAARNEAEGPDAPWQDLGQTTDTRFEHCDIAAGLWTYRVKAISALGVRSNWRERSVEILGLSAPPQALDGLTLQTAGGLAILKWSKSPDPDVRLGGAIVIRHSTAGTPGWANSVSMDRVAGAEALAVVPAKPGTYLLRAEDSGGRLGPVARITTKAAQAVRFAPVDSLMADPGFVGSKTDLGVSGAGLQIAEDLDGTGARITMASEGLFAFGLGLDFGTLRRIRLRSEIDLSVLALQDLIDDRLSPMDSWADFDGAEGAEVDVVLEARETDDDPAAAPVWSDWGRVDSHEIEARAIEARAWLRTTDTGYSPLVTKLRLYADEVSP